MHLSKHFLVFLTALITAVIFLLGFAAGRSSAGTDWVGFLVHGERSDLPDRQMIVPEASEYTPAVDPDVIIGLREDGIVVWKHRADSTR